MALLLHWVQVRVLALLALSYLLASPATAQTMQAPAWQAAVAVAGSPASQVNAVATDSLGNMYMAGSFTGTARFGTFTLSSRGSYDGFIVKWSPVTNTFIWAQSWGGTGGDGVADIAVRGSTIYMTGNASGTGVRVGNLPAVDCSQADAIIIKLVDAGTSSTFVWAYRGGGSRDDVGQNIVVTASGIYVSGNSSSAAVSFGALLTLTSSLSGDGFIVKLVDAGNSATFSWLQLVSGTGAEAMHDMVSAPGNVLYVTGSTSSSTLAFGNSTISNPSTNSFSSGFVAKLLDQGSTSRWEWAQDMSSRGSTNGYTISTSLAVTGANVYILGYFTTDAVAIGNTTITTFPGAIQKQDIFLAKLTDAGTNASVVWARSIGGERLELPGQILVDGSSLYLCGFFESTVDFGGPTVTTVGRGDVFVAKLVDNGLTSQAIWVQQAGGTGIDYARSMAQRDSTLYIGGYFALSLGTTASFGPYTLFAPTASNGINGFGFGAILGTNGRLVPTATRPEDLAAVALFPNPTRQAATLTLPASLAAEGAHVTLLNSLGQRVQQRTLPPHAPSLELDLAGLAAGVYSVQVRVGAQLLSRRLTIF